MKSSRRGKVLGEIQAAGALLLVDEVAKPIRLMTIFAVVQRDDSRNAGIGMPDDTLITDLRLKLKRAVFMMQLMVVATGEKGP